MYCEILLYCVLLILGIYTIMASDWLLDWPSNTACSLADSTSGVSTAHRSLYISFANSSIYCVLCSHLVMGRRWRDQWNHNNHDSGEATEQDGEMKVVDTAQHCWSRVLNPASGRWESKLQHHPTHTHHQTHHQAPEGTLNTHKYTGYITWANKIWDSRLE